MIWHVCPCHGRVVIPKWTHDICQVTREKVEAIERNTIRPRPDMENPPYSPAAPAAVSATGRGDPLG